MASILKVESIQNPNAVSPSIDIDSSGNMTFTGTVTKSGGTANGVLYLNGSGVETSGSALQFDGAILGVNGISIGRGAGAVSTNTAVGASALAANTTGSQNVSVGAIANATNTSGQDNVTVGYFAGRGITTSSYNVAIGTLAVGSNSNPGSGNTGVGYYALNPVTGTANTAVGRQAAENMSSGSYNTAIGAFALDANTTASYNTAVGYQAGYNNTIGQFNVLLGYQAGYRSAGAGTIGDASVFIGYQAGYANQGDNNVGVGNGALNAATTATFNTCIGASSGAAITTGTKNSILGRFTGNQGGFDIRTASNYIFLSDGDGNVRANQGGAFGWYQYNNSASWSTTSDQRIKENIVSLENGLNTICALRPVEFDYKIKDKKHDIGFIAQEYETVLPNQVHTEASISAEIRDLTDGEDIKIIAPNLVPYLVKAIQELKADLDATKAELATLKGN